MNKENIYTKKTYRFIYMFLVVFSVLFFQILYYSFQNSMTDDILEKKSIFVSKIGLPDLSLSDEAYYIRHRTLSTLFSIYPDDATLREYTNSSFSFSHSNIINKSSDEK